MSWDSSHVKTTVCVDPRIPHNRSVIEFKDVFFSIPLHAQEDLGIVYDYYGSGVVRMRHICYED